MNTPTEQPSPRALIAAEAVHGVSTAALVNKPLPQHRHSYIAEECLLIADAILEEAGTSTLTQRVVMASKSLHGVMATLDSGAGLTNNRHRNIARECLRIADAILTADAEVAR